MKLIDNINKAWRFWSIRFSAIGTAIIAFLVAFPNIAFDVWAWLPADIKSSIAPDQMPLIGVIFFVAGMVARIIKQEGLE